MWELESLGIAYPLFINLYIRSQSIKKLDPNGATVILTKLEKEWNST